MDNGNGKCVSYEFSTVGDRTVVTFTNGEGRKFASHSIKNAEIIKTIVNMTTMLTPYERAVIGDIVNM